MRNLFWLGKPMFIVHGAMDGELLSGQVEMEEFKIK
jgi:hypothetical protein